MTKREPPLKGCLNFFFKKKEKYEKTSIRANRKPPLNGASLEADGTTFYMGGLTKKYIKKKKTYLQWLG